MYRTKLSIKSSLNHQDNHRRRSRADLNYHWTIKTVTLSTSACTVQGFQLHESSVTHQDNYLLFLCIFRSRSEADSSSLNHQDKRVLLLCMFRSRCITESSLNHQGNYLLLLLYCLRITIGSSQHIPDNHFLVLYLLPLKALKQLIAEPSRQPSRQLDHHCIFKTIIFSFSICYRTSLLTESSVSHQNNLLLLCMYRKRLSNYSWQNHQDNQHLFLGLYRSLLAIGSSLYIQDNYLLILYLLPYKAPSRIIIKPSNESSPPPPVPLQALY